LRLPTGPPARAANGFELDGSTIGLELISSIAHEIRTPVTALATASELIRDDLHQMGRDELLRLVETMHRGALWLQGLVENLLCAATLNEGRLRISRRRLSLGELARDVTSVIDPLPRQREQWVRVVERRDVGEVLADGRRIGQALINLLVNASKHGRPGTRIDLLIARRAERVRISVADRGPGLPSRDARSLFGAYTRGSEASRAGIDGVGLGLAIVRSIVELHGGSVGASHRRGGGAVFWFEIPVAPAEDPGIVLRERLA
jgi:K+-sensing histidine kinase KdpD